MKSEMKLAEELAWKARREVSDLWWGTPSEAEDMTWIGASRLDGEPIVYLEVHGDPGSTREELEVLRGLFGEEDGFTSDMRGEFYYWLRGR